MRKGSRTCSSESQPTVRTLTASGLPTGGVQLSISRHIDAAGPSAPAHPDVAPEEALGWRAHICFAWLGFSASWTPADVAWNNMGVFMRCLPGGLLLPDYCAIAGQVAAASTLLVFSLLHLIRGPPAYDASVRIVWLLLCFSLVLTAALAAGWRVVVDGVAVAVIGYFFVANGLGTISWIATVPFMASSFDGLVVSSFYAGSGLGSLSGGLLGLLQHGVPGFGPTPVFLLTTLFLAPGVLAWRQIQRHGLGAKGPRRGPGTGSAAPAKGDRAAHTKPRPTPPGAPAGQPDASTGSVDASPGVGMHVDASVDASTGEGVDTSVDVSVVTSLDTSLDASTDPSTAASVAPRAAGGAEDAPSAAALRAEGHASLLSPTSRRSLHFNGYVVRRSLVLYAIALPMNMTTWGFSPNILPFAAAHAGCSCDPSHPEANKAYNLSLSLSFIAMPAAAILSLVLPAYRLRHLAALAFLHAAAFAVEVGATAAAPWFTCGPNSVPFLASSVVALRGIDTYVTAMLFRIAARRFESMPELQQFATSAFGVLLTIGTFIATFAAFVLVEHGAIGCKLVDADWPVGPPPPPGDSGAGFPGPQGEDVCR